MVGEGWGESLRNTSLVVAFVLEGFFVEVEEVSVPREEEAVVVDVQGVVDVRAGCSLDEGQARIGGGGCTLTLRSHRGGLVHLGIGRWGGVLDALVGTRLRRYSRFFLEWSSHPW